MNEVNNNLGNEITDKKQKTFYSTFSIAALILTLIKCFIIIVNIFLDTGFTTEHPLLIASLVLAIVGLKKEHDKLSLIMLIVDIILIIIEIIIFAVIVVLIALLLS